jgi:hypothetical protein
MCPGVGAVTCCISTELIDVVPNATGTILFLQPTVFLPKLTSDSEKRFFYSQNGIWLACSFLVKGLMLQEFSGKWILLLVKAGSSQYFPQRPFALLCACRTEFKPSPTNESGFGLFSKNHHPTSSFVHFPSAAA